jgi:putative ATP-binding cassette transporter
MRRFDRKFFQDFWALIAPYWSSEDKWSAWGLLVVAAPRFFSGQIKLGGLMQISQAFGQVHDALSFIVDSYVGIAQWKAVVDRLLGFSANMRQVESAKALEKIKRQHWSKDQFSLENLTVRLPDGRLLLEELSFRSR